MPRIIRIRVAESRSRPRDDDDERAHGDARGVRTRARAHHRIVRAHLVRSRATRAPTTHECVQFNFISILPLAVMSRECVMR